MGKREGMFGDVGSRDAWGRKIGDVENCCRWRKDAGKKLKTKIFLC